MNMDLGDIRLRRSPAPRWRPSRREETQALKDYIADLKEELEDAEERLKEVESRPSGRTQATDVP
jgi:hypothetical protein